MSKLFDRALPKWPQMIVTGTPVTEDQAKEIIFRTDHFLCDFDSYAGGNNRQFTKLYQNAAGITYIRDKFIAEHPNNHFKSGLKLYDYNDLIQEKIGFIKTNYVFNDWASSCFGWGPHGWVHPDGTIWYNDNVGKWPSVEDIYNDWVMLAEAFPFLDIIATLMSGESCEDNTSEVVSFIITNESVTIKEGNLNLHNQHPIIPKRDKKIRYDSFHELGLNPNWYIEFATRIRSFLELDKNQNAIDQMRNYFHGVQ